MGIFYVPLELLLAFRDGSVSGSRSFRNKMTACGELWSLFEQAITDDES
jgi:hypothetical protein